MAYPPVGTVFRVRVDRKGGTEDGLDYDGGLHVRGPVKPTEAYAVEIIETHSGYSVAEVVNDVSPDEVITLHEWQEENAKSEEEKSDREKRKDLRRLKTSSVQDSDRKSWRKQKQANESEDEDSEQEEKERASDDPIGSKNDLINGNL